MGKLTRKEVKAVIQTIGFGIFSFYIAVNFREILSTWLPSPQQQILFGIVGIIIWGVLFELS
ncbi:MAG: hypothetical protein U9O94_08420 [Nanoarchaeota archaeon]|nr:hypothetical protein [Nanoarchaeota archaeon]